MDKHGETCELFKECEGSPDFSRTYIMQRIEERRSKLAQIKSSFQYLSQNIKTIQSAYVSRGFSPPLMHSDRGFSKIMILIDELMAMLYEMDVTSDYETLMYTEYVLRNGIIKLLNALTGFQHLHDQRISGQQSLKFVDFQHTKQVEYSQIGKVYNAVDALSYELMESCFGKTWLDKTHYVPISVFGLEYSMLPLEYTMLPSGDSLRPLFIITGPDSLITIPYYDCFRARCWPSLAHEVGHVLVMLARSLKHLKLYKTMDLEKEKLTKIFLRSTSPADKHYATSSVSMQLPEIVSDIVSAYICGPASLFSASTLLSLSNWGNSDTFFSSILDRTHPPIEIRLAAMRKVLELLDINICYYNFDKMAGACEKTLKNVPNKKKGVTPKFIEIGKSDVSSGEDNCLNCLLSEYHEEIERFAVEVKNVLQDGKLTPFDGERWISVTSTIKKTGSLRGLTPIELMNVAWGVRQKKDSSDFNLDLTQVFGKRMNENKLFETLVHHMYGYYERAVAIA